MYDRDKYFLSTKLLKLRSLLIIERMTVSLQPECLESVLRQLRYVLHENHYLITDCKRRLIDIYGHKPGYEYDKLSKAVLERKCDYCDHLLSLAGLLSPGKSEFRGYLLMERHGAMLRLAQWDWLRMKVTRCLNQLSSVITFLYFSAQLSSTSTRSPSAVSL